MAFKENKRSFTNETHQCLFEPIRQVDSTGHMASSEVFIGTCALPKGSGEIKRGPGEKFMLDRHNEHLLTANKDYKLHGDVMLADDNSLGDSANVFNFSSVANRKNNDLFHPEPSKRPPNFDVSCERTWKRPRQVYDCCDTLFHEVSHPDCVPEIPHISDVKCLHDANEDVINKVSGDSGDLIGNYPQGMSNITWEDLQRGNANIVSEPSQRVSFHIDCYPRKHVALGPDHQANIPACRSQGPSDVHDGNMEKFLGTCVIPMPDVDSEVSTDVKNWQGNLYCDCTDRGSINCARRHVSEVREQFRETVGSHIFAALGFCDMGEDVALKWTEEEESLFHEVVLRHPASLGQNFWNVLPKVFPFRSNKDLVSYYYNVFILRKRAAQNRCDPMNVDSDNDEWQEREEDSQFNLEDYEEDSVIESIYHGGVYENDDCEEEEDEEEKPFLVQDGEDNVSDDYGIANNGMEQGDVDISEGCVNHHKSSTIPTVESVGNNSESVEHDFQDDSCTSYEFQQIGVDSRGSNEISAPGSAAIETVKNLNGKCKDALSHLSDPVYGGVVCDQKPWESYFSVSEKVDFLPTCSVIEEVFGKGTWDK